jgi:hypothetical protein
MPLHIAIIFNLLPEKDMAPNGPMSDFQFFLPPINTSGVSRKL